MRKTKTGKIVSLSKQSPGGRSYYLAIVNGTGIARQFTTYKEAEEYRRQIEDGEEPLNTNMVASDNGEQTPLQQTGDPVKSSEDNSIQKCEPKKDIYQFSFDDL